MYKHLYQKFCKHSSRIFFEDLSSIKYQNQFIKNCFIDMFANMQIFNKNAVCIHRVIINNLKIPWEKIFNNRICMWCLRRKSKKILFVIMKCVTFVFKFSKKRLIDVKYQYKFENCFLCISKILKITLKFSTIEMKILNINDDEIRNAMSLKFLKILQNLIEHDCLVQNLFNLTFEINSDTRCYTYV